MAKAADPDDRTVLQPRRHAAPARPRAGAELQRLVAGVNPLLGAANVLLALVAQLRATGAHADPAELHRQLLVRLAEFESDARAAGVAPPQVGAARFLLCCFIDEAIAGTPWAGSARSLLEEFHGERGGGDKAFKLLERLGEDTTANRDLLELFYVCLALGFEGRYRGQPNARPQLDAIAERLYEVVRRPPAEVASARTLSLHWQGASVPGQRMLAVLPLWVVFALAAAIVTGALLWANLRLEQRAAPAFRQLVALPQALAAEGWGAAAAAPRLASRLQADIAAGALTVRDEALRSVVSLPADTLFAAGSARVEPAQVALLGRVATALKALPGQVVVSGHTDATLAPSLQFPSNWHLSRARALAVADALAAAGVPAARLRGEGRADAEPVAPQTTEADRARNRRIEVALLLPRPEQ